MLGRINHIGVATPSIEAAKAMYRELYGVPEADMTAIRDMPEHGVRVAFINMPNSQIELIEPLGEHSPLHQFLQKHPHGGQHHICFEVENIFTARDAMVAKGAVVLNEPRIGAHGTLVVFIHPKHSMGVLIELMEAPKDGH